MKETVCVIACGWGNGYLSLYLLRRLHVLHELLKLPFVLGLDVRASPFEYLKTLNFRCQCEDASADGIRDEVERYFHKRARQNLLVVGWFDRGASLVARRQTRDPVRGLQVFGLLLPGLAGGVAIEGEFVAGATLLLVYYAGTVMLAKARKCA